MAGVVSLLVLGGCFFDRGGIAAADSAEPPSDDGAVEMSHGDALVTDLDGAIQPDGPLARDGADGPYQRPDGLSDGPTDGPADGPTVVPKVKLTFKNAGPALHNFPVMVKLDNTRVDYQQVVQSGGIYFVDGDGVTVLAHEIELWSGTSYIWVKVPQIDANTTTDHIWLQYGKSPGGPKATDVWSKGYAAVWHMREDPSGGAQIKDSTPNGNHGTSVGTMTSQDSVAGAVGQALDFDGVDDGIKVQEHNSLDTPTNLTVELWISPRQAYNANERVIDKTYHWDFNFNNDEMWPQFIGKVGSSSSRYTRANFKALPGTWYYLAFTFASGTVKWYVDGATVPTKDTTFAAGDTLNPANQGLSIGNKLSNHYTNGVVDEVRISNATRSVGWIAAQHLSMTDKLITYTMVP